MTVLLLDSDPNRRKVVVEALERSDLAFEIEAAAPGSEVMRRVSEDGDVILDCSQPEKERKRPGEPCRKGPAITLCGLKPI